MLPVQRRAAVTLTNRLPLYYRRFTTSKSSPEQPQPQVIPDANPPPNTHFKITLRRSAISLGENIKGTLVSLGIHRRMQTVYHLHTPEVAGKILKVKELVEVENVPAHAVRTKVEQTRERRATRGYVVKGTRLRELKL